MCVSMDRSRIMEDRNLVMEDGHIAGGWWAIASLRNGHNITEDGSLFVNGEHFDGSGITEDGHLVTDYVSGVRRAGIIIMEGGKFIVEDEDNVIDDDISTMDTSPRRMDIVSGVMAIVTENGHCAYVRQGR